jgi:hypothetical protein
MNRSGVLGTAAREDAIAVARCSKHERVKQCVPRSISRGSSRADRSKAWLSLIVEKTKQANSPVPIGGVCNYMQIGAR